MSNERLYRESITFFLAEPEAFADRNNPTSAELNNADLVYNVTCALWEDDTEFTLGDPSTDDGLTFCSKAGVSNPTLDNPTVVFSVLMDEDRTANGVFNGTLERIMFPDRNYIAGLRIGPDSDVAFASGDEVKLVSVSTDWGVPTVGATDNVRIVQTFLRRGWANWNYRLAA